jgi:hypothetical protein
MLPDMWGRPAAAGAAFAAIALVVGFSQGGAAAPRVQLEFVTAANSPVYVTAPPGDTSRLFVVQRGLAPRP